MMKSFSENLDHVPIEGPTRQSRCDRARSKRKRKEKEKKRKERPDNWRKSNDSPIEEEERLSRKKAEGKKKEEPPNQDGKKKARSSTTDNSCLHTTNHTHLTPEAEEVCSEEERLFP